MLGTGIAAELLELLYDLFDSQKAMEKKIHITKKVPRRGDDGHKVVSVRMREELLERLEELSGKTNRSRNELINLLLEAAIDLVQVEEA